MFYTVLIVDDEKTIRDGLKKIVKWEEFGFEIIGSASNGIEALAFIEKNCYPDVILTDVRMPNMDGLKLIEQVKKANDSVEFIILSGYDYFDYARKAVELGAFDYILKPTKLPDLKTKFLRLKEKLDEEAKKKSIFKQGTKFILEDRIMNILNDENVDPAKILSELQINYQLIEACYFTTIVVRINNITGDKTLNRIYENILEFIDKTAVHFSVIDKDRDLVFLLGDESCIHDPVKLNEIERSIMRIFTFMNRNSYHFRIGKGNSIRGLHKANESYKQAKAAADRGFFASENEIIVYNDRMQIKGVPEYPSNHEKQLIKTIISLDKNGSVDIINSLFKDFFTDHSFDPGCVFNLCIEFIILISRKLFAFSSNDDKAFGENMILNKKVSDFNTIIQLKDWVEKCILSIIEMLNCIQSRNSNRIVDHMKELIEQNYSRQLTLSSVADMLYMNHDYLSRLFKEESGMSFTEYLTSYRVKKAIELLKDISIKSYEVGYLVGYEDPNYFSKIFRKVTGYSVSEYRNTVLSTSHHLKGMGL